MHHWKIGNVNITRVVDEVTGSIGQHILPQATPEAVRSIPWLAPFLDADGRLVLSIHALIVESCGRRILVDTCLGNGKERPIVPQWHMRSTSFLADLADATRLPGGLRARTGARHRNALPTPTAGRIVREGNAYRFEH